MSNNIQVAVRVRPFNSREKAAGATCIVEMDGTQTKLINPAPDDGDDPEKYFTYDFSYYSFDPKAPNYADQSTVFKDLGTLYLNNALEGFNCSLFAYGQTGAGKSYSMTGYGPAKGIIPLGCEELFALIAKKKEEGSKMEYIVEVSYLEIYNEAINDLLNPRNKKKLRIRQNRAVGLYVDGLSKIVVHDYAGIAKLMEEGAAARTVAATAMNATSSRGHSVFSIYVTQKLNKSAKIAKINLVDLAGSERQANTGAKGARLREACAINKSLSALGNVISALADKSSGKKVFVPYRDSILTRLLQESLGGNAKTIMIAAISPASINHEETLSTLRYADRAKKIVNKAKVNESETDRVIRELKEQIAELKASLGSGGAAKGGKSGKQSDAKIADELLAREELIKSLGESMEEKEAFANEVMKEREAVLKDCGISIGELSQVLDMHEDAAKLVNMNADQMLSGSLIYYIDDKRPTTIGSAAGNGIRIGSVGIEELHVSIEKKNSDYYLIPATQGSPVVHVNGKRVVSEEHKLDSGDRILLAKRLLYRFVAGELKDDEFSWEDAMSEVALACGKQFGNSEFVGELIRVDGLVDEANAISEALDKRVSFALDIAGGENDKILIRVFDPFVGRAMEWEADLLESKLTLMRDMLQRFRSTGKKPELGADPFQYELADCLLGKGTLKLKDLGPPKEIANHDTTVILSTEEEGDLSLEYLKLTIDVQTKKRKAGGEVIDASKLPEAAAAAKEASYAVTLGVLGASPGLNMSPGKEEGVYALIKVADWPNPDFTKRKNMVNGVATFDEEFTWNLGQSALDAMFTNTIGFEIYGHEPIPPRMDPEALASDVARLEELNSKLKSKVAKLEPENRAQARKIKDLQRRAQATPKAGPKKGVTQGGAWAEKSSTGMTKEEKEEEEAEMKELGLSAKPGFFTRLQMLFCPGKFYD